MTAFRLTTRLLMVAFLMMVLVDRAEASAHMWISMDPPSSIPIPGSTFTTNLRISSWNGTLAALDLTVSYDPAVIKISGFSTPSDSEFYPNCFADSASFASGQTRIACFQVANWETQTTPATFGTLTWEVVGTLGSTTDVTIAPKTVVDANWNPVEVLAYGLHIATATSTTRALDSGWNLLALPLQPAASLTAQSLLDSLNGPQAGNCSEVDQWLFGGWDSYLNGQGFNDFSIVPGQSYFVTCVNSSNWQLPGYTIQASAPVALETGWNLLSVPYPAAGYQAQSLLNAIAADGGSCGEIDQWLYGGWDSYFTGQNFNDFDILPGQGYFAKCSTSSTFTP
jgi:hypothetical protein